MFITEQHITQNHYNRARKGLFEAGTSLAKSKKVKTRFTYKELTLILGVFVAMIIAITLWSHRDADQHQEQKNTTSSKTIPALHLIVKKTISSVRLGFPI
jgi:hypothetical protein